MPRAHAEPDAESPRCLRLNQTGRSWGEPAPQVPESPKRATDRCTVTGRTACDVLGLRMICMMRRCGRVSEDPPDMMAVGQSASILQRRKGFVCLRVFERLFYRAACSLLALFGSETCGSLAEAPRVPPPWPPRCRAPASSGPCSSTCGKPPSAGEPRPAPPPAPGRTGAGPWSKIQCLATPGGALLG